MEDILITTTSTYYYPDLRQRAQWYMQLRYTGAEDPTYVLEFDIARFLIESASTGVLYGYVLWLDLSTIQK